MRHSTQNYLKAIYSFVEIDDKLIVKVNELAKKLNTSTPSVSEMIKRLEQDGYVKNQPYKGVRLTKKGLDIGKNMTRHHRIWETYLNKVLGFTWDEVHDEAELLEHASSTKVIDKLEELMGFPPFDPHGNPIPDRVGNVPLIKDEKLLSDCNVGDSFKIVRFVDLDKHYLTYLENSGVKLQSQLKIKDILDFDGTMVCSLYNQQLNFSRVAAKHIFVTLK